MGSASSRMRASPAQSSSSTSTTPAPIDSFSPSTDKHPTRTREEEERPATPTPTPSSEAAAPGDVLEPTRDEEPAPRTLAKLKAAALQSAKRKEPAKIPVPTPPSIPPFSHTTTLGPPSTTLVSDARPVTSSLSTAGASSSTAPAPSPATATAATAAQIAVVAEGGDREEGEISEGEEGEIQESIPRSALKPNSFNPATSASGVKNDQSARALPPTRQTAKNNVAVVKGGMKRPLPKGIETKLPAAPINISPTEARQYMDDIRNLLSEGISPDALLRRGATAKYVTAVSEEIVQATKNHKAQDNAPPALKGNSVQNQVQIGITVEMSRQESTSSATSSAIGISQSDRLSLSPSGPTRIHPPLALSPPSPTSKADAPPSRSQGSVSDVSLPASRASAVPSESPASRPTALAVNAPIRVESYKPPQPKQTLPISQFPSRAEPSPPFASSSSSSSTPTAVSTLSQSHLSASAPPFRPTATGPATATTPSARTALRPVQSYVPSGPRAPLHHKKGTQSSGKGKHRNLDLESDPVILLNYEETSPSSPIPATPSLSSSAEQIPPQPKPPTKSMSTKEPFAILAPTAHLPLPPSTVPPDIPAPPPDPPPPLPNSINDALLEVRRKALASMRLRRAKEQMINAAATARSSASSISGTLPTVPIPVVAIIPDVVTVAEVKTIEEEVADLEKEVLQLQSISDEMDIDQPEEGEIESSLPSLPVIPTPPLAVTSLAVPTAAHVPPIPTTSLTVISLAVPTAAPAPRGTKRPNAEDMMESYRPSSAASAPVHRALHPGKRRAFGGHHPHRNHKLVVHLDDEDDDESSSDDDSVSGGGGIRSRSTFTPTVFVGDIIETERLLSEKEASIRLLKEQIAAKLRAKIVKRAQARKDALREGTATPTPTPWTEEEGVEITGIITPAVENPGATVELSSPKIDIPPLTTVQVSKSAEQNEYATLLSDYAGGFRAYKPILARYPLLAKRYGLKMSQDPVSTPTLPVATGSRPRLPLPTSKNKTHPHDDIDESLLASIVLTRRRARGLENTLCAAELDGGACADPSCGDVHFATTMGIGTSTATAMGMGMDIGIKMDILEEDLVEYLQQSLTHTTSAAAKVETLRAALAVAKQTLGLPSKLTTVPPDKARALIIKVCEYLSAPPLPLDMAVM